MEALGPQSDIKRMLSNTAREVAAEWYASLLNRTVSMVLLLSTSMASAIMEKSRYSLLSTMECVTSPRIKRDTYQ